MRAVSALFVDVILSLIATLLAIAMLDGFELGVNRVDVFVPYFAITALTNFAVFGVFGLQRTIWRLSTFPDFLRILYAVVAATLLIVVVSFMAFRLDTISRTLPIQQGLLTLFVLVAARVTMRLLRGGARRTGSAAAAAGDMSGLDNRTVVLVVGVTRITELYLQSIADFGRDTIAVAGLIGRNERHTGRLIQEHAVLGQPEGLIAVLKDLETHGVFVNRIVVTCEPEALSAEAKIQLQQVEATSDIRVDMFTDYLGLTDHGTGGTGAAKPAAVTKSLFDLEGGRAAAMSKRSYWQTKRAIDIVLASLALLLLSPIFILVGILVACDVGPPVLFWQQRPGRRGRPFKVYKFRTMSNSRDRSGRRLADKERVSRVGLLLRRTRLDELPQFYNILRGEMSFIGPRPLLPIDQPAEYRARLLIRPGMTGWAQVMGGREISAIDKAALDVWYTQNASLALDLKILAYTIGVVIFGETVNTAAVQRAWTDLSHLGICSPRPTSERSA